MMVRRLLLTLTFVTTLAGVTGIASTQVSRHVATGYGWSWDQMLRSAMRHYRTAPDASLYNNWSIYPNVNPYTGQQGTRTVDPFDTSVYQPKQYRSFPGGAKQRCPELPLVWC